MKKLIYPILISATTMSASAVLTLNDSFDTGGSPDYTGGVALEGQGPTNTGIAVTGNWANSTNIQVLDTGLDYLDVVYSPESGGSLNATQADGQGRTGRLLAAPFEAATTGTGYFSFLMQTGTDELGGYRAFEMHNGGYGDGLRTFQLGYQSGDFGTTALGEEYGFRVGGVTHTMNTNTGDVTLFVIKVELTNVAGGDQITVWQNPDLTSGEDPTGGFIATGLDLLADRLTFAKYASGSSSVSWDELRGGDTFTEVTGAVPEPSTSLLTGLAGMMFVLRRKR